ncbi:heavy-metal-associated domain-containing protein (plasmid) [Acuticoccus sp. MNP-M23]|uniref:heavy-metal-associated domain-containing protein n=1 Tax=Acuticoccus sp. MNP-M23 TaxID=3072793 RepID=UPI00281508CC|nr:heavy-metal-associated domain-containing protein [Acuticoccus sp. MNP-M23]WMS45236.1 heavy-metal-associated domain-containing protein [Acuticoccus sp. MNP-M23]
MTTFHIPGMHCGGCRATVRKTIHAIDPDAKIDFDNEARQIVLDSRAETAKVQAALTAAGYPATPLSPV